MMKSENAIEVRDLKKSFKVYLDKGSQLKEKILFRSRRRYENREVLKGISFEVKKGEAVALIGHNGCGKSTTLKLLTKIIYPDSGTVEMKGRASSLIELGAGFHPDMSGRENIFLNAAIFGLTREEIEARVDDIIEFSELEEFIDNPVRTYSSGMYMRLAFSVAINVDADILLIDEILAVGDAAFQAKCFNKLREIKNNNTTIIIVSHSLGQIEQICDRSIWIKDGYIQKDGSPAVVDMEYLDYMSRMKTTVGKQTEVENPDGEKRKAEIVNAYITHSDGTTDKNFAVGETVNIVVEYKFNGDVDSNAVFGIKIYRFDGINAYGTNTQNERKKFSLKKSGKVIFSINSLDLVESEYFVDLAIRSSDMLVYDYKFRALDFITTHTIYEEGVAHINHKWVEE